MFRAIYKRVRKQEGFTLVELLVVVAILGILTAIAIPTFGGFQTRAHEAATISELQQVRAAIRYIGIENKEVNATNVGSFLGTDFVGGTYLGKYTFTYTASPPSIAVATTNVQRRNATVTAGGIVITN